MLEMINQKIEAELPDLQIPKYHIVKLRDGVKEFLVYNYTVSEYNWSNDTVESYVVDCSILISLHSATRLVDVMDNILKKSNFQLIATGINKDTMNWEATFYCAFEVNENEI